MASLILCPTLLAQGPLPDAPVPAVAPVSPIVTTRVNTNEAHKFWDRENYALFASSAALSGADFAVTYTNLRNGGRELNPVVRIFGHSAPGLALNFGGQTAGVIGLSYLFHKTGHHRMERIVSFVNMAASASAVGYGMAHR